MIIQSLVKQRKQELEINREKSYPMELRELHEKHDPNGLSVTWFYAPLKGKVSKEYVTKYIAPHFYKINKDKSEHLLINHSDFEKMLLMNVSHIVCTWYGTGYKLSEIQNYRSNIMYFDIDEGLKGINYEEFERKLNKHFHVVQRSNSWKPEKPKYHLYLYLAESITDLSKWKFYYKHFKKGFEDLLNVSFDKSITATKLCFAGQSEGLSFNRELMPVALPNIEDAISKDTNRQLDHMKRNGGKVDSKKLKDCLIQLDEKEALKDHADWKAVVTSVINLVWDGFLDEKECFDIIMSIADETNSTEILFNSCLKTRYAYGFGTFVYYCKNNDIDFTGILSWDYEKEIAASDWDKVITFKEQYLGDSDECKMNLIDIFTMHKKKKVLMQAGTGVGKTYTTIEVARAVNDELGGIVIMVTPRLLLADNIADDFVTDLTELKLTGYDIQHGKVSFEDRKKAVKILTTYDSLGHFENLIYAHGAFGGHVIIMIDEVHMLYSDAGFKGRVVNKFWEQITSYQNLGATIIGITATPEFMDFSDWDYKVKFEQENRENPFLSAEWYQFEKATQGALNLLVNAKPQKPYIAFVEHKETMLKFKDVLGELGKKVITISADDKGKFTPDQKLLVNGRTVADDTSVIICTSVIGAGVSIESTGYNWTTLILAGGKSNNTDPVSCVQYINRLRGTYGKLIIVTGQEGEDDKGEFPIQYLYDKEYCEMIEVAEHMNKNIGERRFKVSTVEYDAGLYFSNRFKISKFKIMANLLESRKNFNKSNPRHLITYLERYYNITFVKAELKNQKDFEYASKEIGLSTPLKKKIIKDFMSDDKQYNDILLIGDESEYFAPLMESLGKDKRNDFKAILDLQLTHFEVVKVLSSEHSYLKIKRSLDDMHKADFTKRVVEGMDISRFIGHEFNDMETIHELLDKASHDACDRLDIQKKVYTGKKIAKYFLIEKVVKSIRNENGQPRKDRKYILVEKLSAETINREFGLQYVPPIEE
ncbi:DEAD/DEAH box helicase family protein [Neobacillus sp. 179-J 1A1 HS]|uniref:DEAD/DEAH box helicase family protein n=1 Tax=Neobacillus driksii TaxID=3035913 RepID=UPI0035BC33E9